MILGGRSRKARRLTFANAAEPARAFACRDAPSGHMHEAAQLPVPPSSRFQKYGKRDVACHDKRDAPSLHDLSPKAGAGQRDRLRGVPSGEIRTRRRKKRAEDVSLPRASDAAHLGGDAVEEMHWEEASCRPAPCASFPRPTGPRPTGPGGRWAAWSTPRRGRRPGTCRSLCSVRGLRRTRSPRREAPCGRWRLRGSIRGRCRSPGSCRS